MVLLCNIPIKCLFRNHFQVNYSFITTVFENKIYSGNLMLIIIIGFSKWINFTNHRLT